MPSDPQTHTTDSTPGDEQQPMRRKIVRINGRFLLLLIVVVLGLGGATYALHDSQMERNADFLLKMAIETEAKGETKEAIGYLQQYLRFQPKDYDAKVRFANLIEQSTLENRALLSVFRVLEDVLRNTPDRPDARELRRRVVELSLSLGRPRDAMAHLKILMKDQSSDPELIFLEGQSYEALGTYRSAIVKYLSAIQKSKQTVDHYARLAALLTAHPDAMPYREELEKLQDVTLEDSLTSLFPPRKSSPSETAATKETDKPETSGKAIEDPIAALTRGVVEKIYAQLVQQGKPQHQSLVTRANYYLSQRMFLDAQKDIDNALSQAADDPDVLTTACNLALARAGQASLEYKQTERKTYLDSAFEHAKQGTQLTAPDNFRFHERLAHVERQRSTFSENLIDRTTHLNNADTYLLDGLKALNDYKAAKDYSSVKKSEELSERSNLLVQEITIRILRSEVLLSAVREENGGINKGKLEEYSKELQHLKDLGTPAYHLGLIEAQSLLAQRRWREATERLIPIRGKIEQSPLLRRQMDQALAECYRQLHNHTSRIQVLQEGLSGDALWHQGRLLLAATLADRNRLDEAINHYRFLLQHKIAEASLAAIRLQIRQMAQKSDDERDVSAIHSNIDAAENNKLDESAITLLRVDAHFIDSKTPDETRFSKIKNLLDAALQEDPDNEEILATQAKFEAKRTDITPQATRLQNAITLLDQAEKKLGKQPVLMIARAEIATDMSVESALPILQELTTQVQALPREKQTAVLDVIARSYEQLNMLEESHAIWKQLTELSTDKLRTRLASALVAIRKGDLKGLEADLKVIKEIEGPNGPWGNYFSGLGTITSAFGEYRSGRAKIPDQPKEKQKTFEKALTETLQKKLVGARGAFEKSVQLQPQWPELSHQLGHVESLLGNRNEAYRHYRRAIDLGDRTSPAFTITVGYLVDERRFDEADALIRLAGGAGGTLLSSDKMNLSDQKVTLPEMAIQVAYAKGEISRAEKYLPEESLDYRNDLLRALFHLTEYQALADDQKSNPRGKKFLKQAEDRFNRAVKNSPDAPQPWIFWVYHLGRLNRVDEAEKIIAGAHKSLPESVKDITAARCYAIVGNNQKAEQFFQEAVRNNPDDAGLLLSTARFYVNLRQFDKAGPHLDKILDPKFQATDGQQNVARHLKVVSVANRGRYSDLAKALEMLVSPQAASLAELYTRAVILQKSPLKRDHLALIEVLEQINEHRLLTPEDRFLLARLYGEGGRWDESRQAMEILLKNDPKNSGMLYWYAGACIRNRGKGQGELLLASQLLTRLKSAERDSLRVAALEARLHQAEGRKTEAAATLAQAANRIIENNEKPTTDELNRLRSVATLCEELDLNSAAENILRRHAKLAGHPESILTVATFLGKQSRYSEALEICQKAKETASPLAVGVTIVNVVSLGTPSERDLESALNLFKEILKTDSGSSRLQIAYAGLLTVANHLDDSEAVYHQLLLRSPDNIAVLNNLSWLLAMRKKSVPEALALIDHAISVAGPHDELLDTRAVILTRMGKAQDAIPILQEALQEEAMDAYYLHLAQAYLAIGEKSNAMDAMEQAFEAGLTLEHLHRLEHPGYHSAVKATGINQNGNEL